MASRTNAACRVAYREREIVVYGRPAPVHLEAERLLRQFASSALPYRIVTDRGDTVVLRAQ